jgi:hypothetical protein
MSTPLYQIELLEYRNERSYASVRIQKLDAGLSSEWWVSSMSGEDLQLGGSISIPLFGETLEDGERRCRLIAEEVMEFMSWAGGGEAGVGGSADEYRRAHCRNHLAEWSEALYVSSVTAKTADLYLLATQFNINNPAALIAQVEGLSSVRTVHERLAHARRIGLLDSPGKGNIRPKQDK